MAKRERFAYDIIDNLNKIFSSALTHSEQDPT